MTESLELLGKIPLLPGLLTSQEAGAGNSEGSGADNSRSGEATLNKSSLFDWISSQVGWGYLRSKLLQFCEEKMKFKLVLYVNTFFYNSRYECEENYKT